MTLLDLNIAVIAPELALFGLLVVVMLVDLFGRPGSPWVQGLAVGGLVVLGAWQFAQVPSITPQLGMGGLVVADAMGALLKGTGAWATAAALVYAQHTLAPQAMGRGDYIYFALFSLLGGFVIIGGAHMLTLYLGIELMSLALYASVALRRDSPTSVEAGMKYFVLGALASGFLLYGMSMIYGATGSLHLTDVSDALAQGSADRLVMIFGTVFLVAGIAFKLGAVPFHMWVPDVYQGAPTASTLLIAAAPKLAAFALIIRLLVSGLLGVAGDWQQMLLVLCVLSLTVGNLVAIMQTNLKRVLAYSTISHMGFLLIPLATASSVDGYGAALFYIVTYALTTLAGFGTMLLAQRAGLEFDTLEDFKGLAHTHPGLAAVMLAVAFSLAGIPPTVGFVAKLSVLEIAVTQGYLALAIFAVLASLIGAFYYLRIVKVMFFDEPAEGVPPTGYGLGASTLLSVNGVAVLLLGLLPGPLLAFCIEAIRLSLAA